MTESCDLNGPCHEVESLVRAAQEYVCASDDLRPRVLEAARLNCRERRAQRWIRNVAVCIVLLAFLSIADREGSNGERHRPIGIVAAAGFDEFFSPTAVAATRSGDGDWRMLDAFTELRRQQAQLLHLAL